MMLILSPIKFKQALMLETNVWLYYFNNLMCPDDVSLLLFYTFAFVSNSHGQGC